MAIKKSELYSSLWASCDELWGGMDASQYKDYVLVLLFIKYISDKYAGVPYAPITVPEGSSFKDMVALKGKPTIGDDINKKMAYLNCGWEIVSVYSLQMQIRKFIFADMSLSANKIQAYLQKNERLEWI